MFLAGPSVGQLAVDWNSCRTRLTLPTVEGAATYEFIRECSVAPCNPILYPCQTLATTVLPAYEFVLQSTFHGRFRVIARNASQQVVADFPSASYASQFLANGAPVIASEPQVVRGFLGESVLVRTTEVPSDVQIRWLRDGVEIPGATGSQISVALDSTMDGEEFVPIATSACGTMTGGARVIDISPLPPSGVLQWRLIRQTQSGQEGSWINSCGFPQCPGPLVTVVSDFPTVNGSFASDAFAAAVGSSGVGTYGSGPIRIEFEVNAPVRGVFSGGNWPGLFNCTPSVCGTVQSSLVGPVSVSFAAMILRGSWGPVEVDMPPGNYSIQLLASRSVYCGPGGNCVPCGHGGVDLSATFIPVCSGDINGDGVVSSSDLSELFGAWGSTGTNPADLDLDGYVGNADLALLLGNWGACP
jgi:hypothetical protein